ncbi:MAG: response regulator [Myxococcales bacterium]|jgi:two-component system chemotaxis sensor kinase CheA|nr:response regulator [Myxococcales bacterium]
MKTPEGFTRAQIEQLSEIFRTEAIEHVRNIASVLFSIEDGRTDIPESISHAFRDAHSLKGSANTLGFLRVAIMAHHFEDALGTIRDQRRSLSVADLDTLLNTLEAIRASIYASEPGDDQLSENENQTLQQLNATFSLQPPRTTASSPPAHVPSPPNAAPSADTAQTTGGFSKEDEAGKQDFVRVSERRIDNVINQFGELFESSLQFESVGHDLATNVHESDRLAEALQKHLQKLSGSALEADVIELLGMAKNLAILSRSAQHNFFSEERHLQKLLLRTQDGLRAIRIAPISNLHITIRNQVREVARAVGKKVALELAGGEYAVDRAILDALEKPLIHLLRNAVDHGIEPPEQRRKAGKRESGTIAVVARHMGDAVELSIEDDGRGISPEGIKEVLQTNFSLSETQIAELSTDQLYDYLFESGFSTTTRVSQISGRGVGLDVVKHTVEQFGGEVSLRSTPGEGTRIALRLPLTMSSIRCLLFGVGLQTMAVPAANIEKVLVLLEKDIQKVGGGDVINYAGGHLPLSSFQEVLQLSNAAHMSAQQNTGFAAVLRFGERRFAFAFDQIFEYTQLIIKPLGDLLERVPNVSGLALLGTGKLALVLNPADLIRSASGLSATKLPTVPPAAIQQRTVLIVDDSIAVRTMQKALLESSGFKVLSASDGLQALQLLAYNTVDAVLSDVQMPNMDGFELTRVIKSRDKTKNIPVILVTSLGSDADIQAGLASGADGHIIKKELTRSELLKTINQLI